MMQQINFRRLKHQSPYFFVNGIKLTSWNLYQILFLQELEHAGIKYTSMNVKILELTRRGLVDLKATNEGMFCYITPKGKAIIKEITA